MSESNHIIIFLDTLRIGYTSGKLKKELTSPLFASSDGGELIAVIGRNGIGKSTLLRTLAGLQEALGGCLELYGKEISEYNRMDLARKVGYISTEIIRASNMTVLDLVSLGRYPHTNWIGRIDSESKKIIESSLQKTGLATFRKRNISELSDGERQKAMIARVLAQNTDLMIMDEPTAFLDISSKFEIVNLMHELTREGKTIIFSTHDFNVAVNHADKIWLMLDTGLHEGAPEDLMLSGSFNHLFKSPVIGFNSGDGSITFIKKSHRKIGLSGEGIMRNWTERALLRSGFNISEKGNELNIRVPDEKEKKWILNDRESAEYFSSIYDLIRRLQ